MFADAATRSEALEQVSAHPWVERAWWDEAGERGVLRVRIAPHACAPGPEPGGLLAEFLTHWSGVYDEIYDGLGSRPSALDLSGWSASDTGLPFDAAHMREWADGAADLVLRQRPRWVLELGSGTGMLAHRLRAHVEGYLGTDIVPAAVDALRSTVGHPAHFLAAAAHEVGSGRVRRALAAAGCPASGPDCVLLNSVVQYFPDTAYLAHVLREAVGLVAPGGVVIVGDVRHAGLLDPYCRWLERSAAAPVSEDDLRRRAGERAAREPELLVTPAGLAALAAAGGRRVWMSAHPKPMRADTELTRYRFDAVLHVDAPPRSGAAEPVRPRETDWSRVARPGLRLEALASRLTDPPVRVLRVPNRLLTDEADAVTPDQLRTATTGLDAAVTLDFADPCSLEVVAPASAAAVPVERFVGGGGAGPPPQTKNRQA
ncbi:class I SAM-dependent methyltransferase, partial [Streptomyces sp. NPDC049881]|uniref:class I SAM-dependent methyltransferase n=1 Tax=Streptomyces sp. NPDC049881 TaxID=3155778 RepID=UPI0034335A77